MFHIRLFIPEIQSQSISCTHHRVRILSLSCQLPCICPIPPLVFPLHNKWQIHVACDHHDFAQGIGLPYCLLEQATMSNRDEFNSAPRPRPGRGGHKFFFLKRAKKLKIGLSFNNYCGLTIICTFFEHNTN